MSKLYREEDVLVQQPRLGMGVYIGIVLFMMTTQWMTLDMYLPALPVLKEEFEVSEAILNISLNSDLVLCAIGSLIGGTLSDKYGRNPVTLVGLIMTGITLLACAWSQNVWFLTVMRGLSGLGGGFALTVAAAICRDSFRGRSFQTVTTFSQASAIIGPVFAPAIGSFLIEFLSWRWIFIVLGSITLITAIPFFVAEETWPKHKRQVESVWQATMQTLGIAKSREYQVFITVIMLLTIPEWAYLGVCSYVYYDDFGVTNLQYSILYACGTGVSFAAPFVYIFLTKGLTNRRIVEFTMLLLALSAVLLLLVGPRGPVLFLVAVAPFMCAEGILRPMSLVVILDQYQEEAGGASALTSFAMMIIGVVATAVATLQWSSFLFGLAMIVTASLLLALVGWIFMLRRKMYAKQLGMHGEH